MPRPVSRGGKRRACRLASSGSCSSSTAPTHALAAPASSKPRTSTHRASSSAESGPLGAAALTPRGVAAAGATAAEVRLLPASRKMPSASTVPPIAGGAPGGGGGALPSGSFSPAEAASEKTARAEVKSKGAR